MLLEEGYNYNKISMGIDIQVIILWFHAPIFNADLVAYYHTCSMEECKDAPDGMANEQHLQASHKIIK